MPLDSYDDWVIVGGISSVLFDVDETPDAVRFKANLPRGVIVTLGLGVHCPVNLKDTPPKFNSEFSLEKRWLEEVYFSGATCQVQPGRTPEGTESSSKHPIFKG